MRLHVQAKRYLCAVQPGYLEALSADSKRSLALQGGPFDGARAAAFIRTPHAAGAVRLRLWDDKAKCAALAVPDLCSWRPLLARCARAAA